MGYHKEAQEHMKKMGFIVEKISPFLNKYYIKHYTLIREIIFNTNIKTYNELKSYIEDNSSIFSSRIWKRFKIGYLFTDIQIWLSS